MRVGLLASTGKHLDSFFPDIREEMGRRGVTVFAASGSRPERMPGDLIKGLTQAPALSSPAAVSSLRAWSANRELDVILSNTATASTLVRVANPPIPIIYFCHGLHWNTGRRPSERVWRLLESSLLPRTSGIVTINTDDAAWFEKNAPRVRRLYLESGVGVPESFLAKPAPLPDTPEVRLLWVGDFSNRKRPWLAVEVSEKLREHGLHFSLTMLGDGPLLDSIRKDVDRRKLSPWVKVVGRVASTLAYLDESHVIIHTSKWEGLPRVLLESVARRRQTIAFDVKGVRDVPGAILSTDGDSSEMASQIIDCANARESIWTDADQSVIRSSTEVAVTLIEFIRSVASQA